jgi:hypothetical protein
MKRLGFQEKDLLLKTFGDIEKEGVPPEFENDHEFFVKVKAEYQEKRRKDRMQKLLEVTDCIF